MKTRRRRCTIDGTMDWSICSIATLEPGLTTDFTASRFRHAQLVEAVYTYLKINLFSIEARGQTDRDFGVFSPSERWSPISLKVSVFGCPVVGELAKEMKGQRQTMRLLPESVKCPPLSRTKSEERSVRRRNKPMKTGLLRL